MKLFIILYSLILVTCKVNSKPSTAVKTSIITAELEGTFKLKGGLTKIFGIHGKVELSETTKGKRENEKSGIEFNGTVTFRRGEKVAAIGAHANFEVEDRTVIGQSDEFHSSMESNLDTNRIKRRSSPPKLLIGLYGQLNFAEFGHSIAVGMDASFSLQTVVNENFEKNPSGEGEIQNVSEDVEFSGSLQIGIVQRSEKLDVIFNLILKDKGFETQTESDLGERFKREQEENIVVTTFKGRFSPPKFPVYTLIEGEVKLWDLSDKERPTPKEKFIKRVSDEVLLYDIDANLTTKIGHKEFGIPVQSQLLFFDARRTSVKREVHSDNRFELSLDAVVQGTFGSPNRQSIYGLNADVELWEI